MPVGSDKWTLTYSNYDETRAAAMPEKYPPYKSKGWDMGLLSNGLLWMMRDIQMHAITEENAAEVYARMKVMQDVEGVHLWGGTDLGYVVVTPEHVYDHVGLVTNVVAWPRLGWQKILPDALAAARAEYRAYVSQVEAARETVSV